MLPKTKCSLFTWQKCTPEDEFDRCTEFETKSAGRAIIGRKATVIVNIVIVIGSNNRILISCVFDFYPNSDCLQTKRRKRMFSSDWNVYPTGVCVFVSVFECTISKIRNSNRGRPKTVPISHGRCRPAQSWWRNCSHCASVRVCITDSALFFSS